jgi:thioester reductase-like protein
MQRNVLLTGSTGILGSRTLIELLHDDDTHVYCPVRTNSTFLPFDRVRNSMRIYAPNISDAETSRVHAFPCDLTSDAIDSLVSEVIDPRKLDLVIHCSALTSFMSSHKELSSSNQNVTLKMIDFVNRYSVNESIFVSSYSIFGGNLFAKGEITQNDLDIGQNFESLRYAESKFRTEIILREKLDKKLKTAIVRPGNLHPDAGTGFHPALSTRGDDFFFDMLNFFFVSDQVPTGNFRYDVTPVDWVAKAIATFRPTKSCETLHLLNPTPPSLDEIHAVVKKFRPNQKGIPAKEFFTNVAGTLNRRYRPLRLLSLWSKEFEIYFEESAHFHSDFTDTSWPTNEKLIELYYKTWKGRTDENAYEMVGLGR